MGEQFSGETESWRQLHLAAESLGEEGREKRGGGSENEVGQLLHTKRNGKEGGQNGVVELMEYMQ